MGKFIRLITNDGSVVWIECSDVHRVESETFGGTTSSAIHRVEKSIVYCKQTPDEIIEAMARAAQNEKSM